MKKNKKVSEDEMPQLEALSELDLTRMLLNRARVELAEAKAKLAKQAFACAAMQGELSAARLEAQTNRNLETTKGAEAAAEVALQNTRAASRILAEDIGKRYAVDWQRAVFDAETGQIVRLPGDT